eukprot:342587-Chlamydomonas_euryale.AAC.4
MQHNVQHRKTNVGGSCLAFPVVRHLGWRRLSWRGGTDIVLKSRVSPMAPHMYGSSSLAHITIVGRPLLMCRVSRFSCSSSSSVIHYDLHLEWHSCFPTTLHDAMHAAFMLNFMPNFALAFHTDLHAQRWHRHMRHRQGAA